MNSVGDLMKIYDEDKLLRDAANTNFENTPATPPPVKKPRRMYADELLAMIQKNGGRCSVDDVQKWCSHRSYTTSMRQLERLVTAGSGDWVPGQERVVFEVYPAEKMRLPVRTHGKPRPTPKQFHKFLVEKYGAEGVSPHELSYVDAPFGGMPQDYRKVMDRLVNMGKALWKEVPVKHRTKTTTRLRCVPILETVPEATPTPATPDAEEGITLTRAQWLELMRGIEEKVLAQVRS